MIYTLYSGQGERPTSAGMTNVLLGDHSVFIASLCDDSFGESPLCKGITVLIQYWLPCIDRSSHPCPSDQWDMGEHGLCQEENEIRPISLISSYEADMTPIPITFPPLLLIGTVADAIKTFVFKIPLDPFEKNHHPGTPG